jgi:hypothetical protein
MLHFGQRGPLLSLSNIGAREVWFLVQEKRYVPAIQSETLTKKPP